MPATGLSFSSSTTTAILAVPGSTPTFSAPVQGGIRPLTSSANVFSRLVAVLSVMAAFRERALDAIAVTQAKAVGLFNINMHFQHRIRAHPDHHVAENAAAIAVDTHVNLHPVAQGAALGVGGRNMNMAPATIAPSVLLTRPRGPIISIPGESRRLPDILNGALTPRTKLSETEISTGWRCARPRTRTLVSSPLVRAASPSLRRHTGPAVLPLSCG